MHAMQTQFIVVVALLIGFANETLAANIEFILRESYVAACEENDDSCVGDPAALEESHSGELLLQRDEDDISFTVEMARNETVRIQLSVQILPGELAVVTYMEHDGATQLFWASQAQGHIEYMPTTCGCGDIRFELLLTDNGADGVIASEDDLVRHIANGLVTLTEQRCLAPSALTFDNGVTTAELTCPQPTPAAEPTLQPPRDDPDVVYGYASETVVVHDHYVWTSDSTQDERVDYDDGCGGGDWSEEEDYGDGCEGDYDSSSEYDSGGCDGDDYDSGADGCDSGSCEGDAMAATGTRRKHHRRGGYTMPFGLALLAAVRMRRRRRR